MAKILIAVGAGTASCLHHDQMVPLLLENKGVIQTTRASHVEPDSKYQEEHGLPYTPWYVDLSPSGGPSYIPGFKTKDAALAFEVQWINENIFKTGEAIPLTIPTFGDEKPE